jgi:hypothetical protein
MRRWRATAVCALLAATALSIGTAPAQGRALFGVSTLDYPYAGELQTMRRGGVDVVRLSIYWQRVEPNPGAPRDWITYDALFGAAANAGVRILPLLHGSPRWVNANFQRPPLQAAWKWQAWARFVQDFAARYGASGTFWKLHPSLPYLPPTAWLVWNEPNLRYFWGGKPSPRRYLSLLRITSTALHAADPSALVLVGGLFEHARQGFGTPASRFLQALYRLRGARNWFDGVALHPFAVKPRGVVANVARSRRVMNRHGDAAKPIWVDEFGWTVRGVGFRRSPFRATLGQQAKRLATTYGLLGRRPGLGLGAVLWFCWRDGAEDLWIYRMGLFNRAFQPRPAWFAFARVAGGTP